MPALIDISGIKYGRWTAIRRSERPSFWDCVCSCGNKKPVRIATLRNGASRSCGCLADEEIGNRRRSHGRARTSIYRTWCHMIGRCYCPTDTGYHNYGGRGITVCARWLESFENFFSDMGDRPHGMSLDRKNNNDGYSPENCRWASRIVQNSNKRNNRPVIAFGESKLMGQWANDPRCVVGHGILYWRIRTRGWPAERAMTTPTGIIK